MGIWVPGGGTHEGGGVGAVDAKYRNGGLHVRRGGGGGVGPGLRGDGDAGRGPDGAEERLSREHICGVFSNWSELRLSRGKGSDGARCGGHWRSIGDVDESSTSGLCSGMGLARQKLMVPWLSGDERGSRIAICYIIRSARSLELVEPHHCSALNDKHEEIRGPEGGGITVCS